MGSKILIGAVLGTVLGILDGLSALVSAPGDPAVRAGIVGIVIGSTTKGLIGGLLIGWFARRVHSVPKGVAFGTLVGAMLAALVCLAQMAGNQPPYWVEIMLPGSLVGLIVGLATQLMGKPAAARTT